METDVVETLACDKSPKLLASPNVAIVIYSMVFDTAGLYPPPHTPRVDDDVAPLFPSSRQRRVGPKQ